ncbi:alpha/beta hydrolase family protein [Neptunomonas concharum]|uniref:Alpha/beta hydrolase n=1 Tax=Neptunomonas concharum TaxID=1031538 RepID=A0A5P1RAJ6_9GAMM|nr:alpha/beta fold hydrolase [Neptunomonas concharum]QEQ96674.1 alpha/beta hydrolase [Neptunomonas concharum]
MTAKRRSPITTRLLTGLAIAVLALGALTTVAEEEPFERREIRFMHGGNTLQGVLILPATIKEITSCMVFVHGSGNTPRDAYGYYESIWRLFARKGWCSLSWDKPGVGGSGGDWRSQSMEDRATETSSAIEFLRNTAGFESVKIGLIGFSQAGWVMPKVANQREDIAFMISVSGAVNWMEQSRYSGRKRMEAEGMSEQEIKAEERAAASIDALLQNDAPYQTYLAHIAEDSNTEPMSEAFWGFAKRNQYVDVRADLRAINVPVLALFGSHDAYVEPVSSAATYRAELNRSAAPFFEVRIFDRADHGLMKTNDIKPAHQGIEAWFKLLSIWFGGDDIFAEGFLDSMAAWLDRFADQEG